MTDNDSSKALNSPKTVAQFDEFLVSCNALGIESNAQVLSQFRPRLRKDLRTELLGRGVTELEKAYVSWSKTLML